MKAIYLLLDLIKQFKNNNEKTIILKLINIVFMSDNLTSLSQMVDLTESFEVSKMSNVVSTFKNNSHINNFFNNYKSEIHDTN